jgi:hypothetical protein
MESSCPSFETRQLKSGYRFCKPWAENPEGQGRRLQMERANGQGIGAFFQERRFELGGVLTKRTSVRFRMLGLDGNPRALVAVLSRSAGLPV